MKKKLIIDIYLDEEKELYNKFDKTKLSKELGDYIYSRCYGHNPKSKVNLHFYIPKFNNEELLIDLVKDNFKREYKEDKQYLIDTYKKSIFLLLFGLSLIFLHYYFQEQNEVIAEVFQITGWVGIWELTYNILFYNVKKKLEIKRDRQISNSIIELN